MSTYASLHYHIVFSTRNRKPWINSSWEPRLHEYLGGTACGLNAVPQGIGGIEDHVHLLIGLRPTHCIADFIRELKKSTSTWIRRNIGVKNFSWQDGYGIFSVSATNRGRVQAYIKRQREHHKKNNYREELVELLKMASVEYDPNYLE